jgi:hypothetical protein
VIAVEVGNGDGSPGTSCGDDRQIKTAVASAQENSHGSHIVPGHDEIEVTVAAYVGGLNRVGARPGGEGLRRLEGAIAVSGQDLHVVIVESGRGQVEFAVGVEFADGHGYDAETGGEIAGRLQCAVAVT